MTLKFKRKAFSWKPYALLETCYCWLQWRHAMKPNRKRENVLKLNLMWEHLQQPRKIFVCLKSKQYILPFAYPLFQIHFSTDFLSHSLSYLNIISSFIIYYFFNNYTSSNIFLFNTLIIIIEKMIWRMNSSSSDLMSYCSLAQKKTKFTEFARALLEHKQCTISPNFS